MEYRTFSGIAAALDGDRRPLMGPTLLRTESVEANFTAATAHHTHKATPHRAPPRPAPPRSLRYEGQNLESKLLEVTWRGRRKVADVADVFDSP